MDLILDLEENQKNIYVIKRKLTVLKPIQVGHYEYDVGYFTVKIRTRYGDSYSSLINYPTVDVDVFECVGDKSDINNYKIVSLLSDRRFKDYAPIMYKVFDGPNGTVNLSDGRDMPILQLCELIRYLYRLTNLTAFL